ncbi:helix-turn-helix domain-containing protein [Mycolicibacterium fortuitum]|uniref:helix-turn-helix domain-containing protein n=1 Tax=Mycolicibacterium fortuitum TaxID=1766 RepID=UPI001CDBA530|nr:helix-turn-helix transcriptional regulator [Mycolicibacterium fortuitum]UBV14964.1 helix-turn-helix transcriptional regulator [Mycolicibacterium fortuitum]
MKPTSEPLSQVIGRNVRELRLGAGLTQQDVATAMVRLGLPWDSGRVARLEAGSGSPTLPTLVLVAVALDQLTAGRRKVTVVDLLRSGAVVELSPGVEVASTALVGVLRGGRAGDLIEGTLYPFARTGMSPLLVTLRAAYGRAEQRAAAELGVDRETMLRLSAELWGRSLSAERDARAEVANVTSRVEKARITRTLIGEAEALWARWGAEEQG